MDNPSFTLFFFCPYRFVHDGWNITAYQGLFCPPNKPACDRLLGSVQLVKRQISPDYPVWGSREIECKEIRVIIFGTGRYRRPEKVEHRTYNVFLENCRLQYFLNFIMLSSHK